MSGPVIDNIARLRVRPLGLRGGRALSFVSANAGLHHQLYVNGRLADWTETPDARRFVLPRSPGPVRLAVVAVAPADRARDFAAALPPVGARPSWVCEFAWTLGADAPVGWRAELLGDGADGTLDDEPLAAAALHPAWSARWGFGRDRFGAGAAGWDGTLAPGLHGAMGFGPFGFDARRIRLAAALAETGTHELLLRCVDAAGRTATLATDYVDAAPPPPPPSSVTPVSYDASGATLVLRIL